MKNLITLIIFAAIFIIGIALDCVLIEKIVGLFPAISKGWEIALITGLWLIFALLTGFAIFLASYFVSILVRSVLKEVL